MPTHKLRATIPENHHLSLEVPEEVPAGPAEIIIVTPAPQKRKIVRLGGVLAGTEDWLQEPGDPIAEALEELRQERQALLDRKHEELLRGDSD